MKKSSKPGRRALVPVIVVSVILVVIAIPFLYELLTFDPRQQETQVNLPQTDEELEAEAAALLEIGDPANGDALIEKHGCYACHRIGVVNGIAPAFVDMAEIAAERRPPLSGPAYILQSILYPMAYVVDDFDPAMPQNFSEVLTQQELADLLAYLTSPDAQ
ncbi:MAG: c-type cytochrome [Anaerolineae bacterium]|nr:c-type cytochrome [Anaerolineae bacterium]